MSFFTDLDLGVSRQSVASLVNNLFSEASAPAPPLSTVVPTTTTAAAAAGGGEGEVDNYRSAAARAVEVAIGAAESDEEGGRQPHRHFWTPEQERA